MFMNGSTCMLTTFDNPYDPFTDFKNWFLFDVQHHYDCCAVLARTVRDSDGFTEEENNQAIEDAIDEIIFSDPFNIYRKVWPKVASPA